MSDALTSHPVLEAETMWRYMRQLVESADSATWIAEDDGQIAGFAIVEWA